ncbi:MAG: ParB/RepB/Spo0J family partition protein [Actinobacteria bacterium]|jgi:ParB family chromosome partitioning protein|nr:ParB/RepB/Spo0J family partition protein [Actinomycetota bacterium]MBT3687882.1 ParB/RepB/Spo0J family partition protein [Actinomycetota bacterium]MBT4036605.1 ParB/RepB/Spo0J family partition protein [Actinomycetota bacterium]MBT4278656.1 ParB/RepB/Spo0J family partition protein [Actinomycetota bacterium]MBT4342454.1 ParB/RepB/Spo0J family partition protein [Actinomycetota bacterium]
MNRPTGLGRGLAALIPEPAVVPPELVGEGASDSHKNDSRYVDIPVDSLSPNRLQPRSDFDDERMDELTRSIGEVGVLQPVLVRQTTDGYELVAGERRWRAARRVGLATIPAIVRTTDDRTALEHAVVENLHRDDLNPLEEAQAYHRLMDEFQMTQHEVAERVGRSRPAVANSVRLLQLPDRILGMLRDGVVSAGHGRALAGLDDRQVQETVADRITDEGLSVRQTEDLVRDLAQPVQAPVIAPLPGSMPDAGLLEVERLLSARLDTTVKVTTRGRRGRITVSFADRDDLTRIFDILNS